MRRYGSDVLAERSRDIAHGYSKGTDPAFLRNAQTQLRHVSHTAL